MERHPFALKGHGARSGMGLIALTLVCLSAGCTSTAQWFSATGGNAKPSGPPQHMEAFFTKGVQWVPDPTKNGQPGPLLACRLFFFPGEDVGATSTAEGTLTVNLFDDSGRKTGQPSKQLEQWVFNSEILQKLQQKDPWLGVGYMVGLPWPSYRPDITEVHLTLRFEPANAGQPLSTISGIMALGGSADAGIQQAKFTR
ncbi:MAG TPA: hypothetical protein VGZ47_21890 [Gemmataceae bacterium]|jgi:hypothetical protein|nr:hypothetical protein [Gemmataceae bacterium]